ncbi:MAG: hypothetical protein HY924_15250 [Elusimicrobia bacterium]|nr:hypothetical protein [Elusimicrobiota bacterium]
MRFSEIKKKRPDGEPSQAPKAPAAESPSPKPQAPGPKKADPAKPALRPAGRELAPACGRSAEVSPGPASKAQVRTAEECYGALISLVKDLARHWGEDLPRLSARVLPVVTSCLAALRAQPSPLLCLTARSTASNYIYAHSANTAILSMYLALGRGWPSQALRLLGLDALLHEFRLAELLKLPLETGSPTAEEMREQKLHPVEPGTLRQHLVNLAATVKHSAEDGIPDISLGVHILGICDIYESLSHFRAWREPMVPHDAIRTLIKDHADGFDRKAKELLLQRLTLYPPGSFVHLSQGQTACVTSVDPRTPTLPTVSVRLDPAGVPLDPPQRVDLSGNSLVHIACPVDETKLGLKDKKVLMALQAERWWVS